MSRQGRPGASQAPRKVEPPVIAGRVPPHDLDAEAAVLSACMLKRTAFDEVVSIIGADDFYSDANGKIFEAMLALASESKPIDVVSVAGWLKDRERLSQIGGSAYLAQIVDTTPAIAHVEEHALIIATKRRLRKVIAEAHRIAAEGYGDVGDPEEWLSSAEGAIAAAAERKNVEDDLEHVSTILQRSWKRVLDRLDGKEPPGISIGIPDLDRQMNYLRPGDVFVIGARSFIGKSSIARQFGAYVAGVGAPKVQGGVLIWSGEQGREEAVDSVNYQRSKTPESKMRDKATLNANDWQNLTASSSEINRAPIWVNDRSAITPLALLSSIRRTKRFLSQRKKPDGTTDSLAMVIVDYVQLMSHAGIASDKVRQEQVAALSRKMKQIAKDEKVVMVVLAQLNKDSDKREGGRPRPSDLRESNALEQDADKLLLVHNPHQIERMQKHHDGVDYKTPASEVVELIVGKARGGGTVGIVRSVFFPAFGRFEAYDGRDD